MLYALMVAGGRACKDPGLAVLRTGVVRGLASSGANLSMVMLTARIKSVSSMRSNLFLFMLARKVALQEVQ